MLKKNGIEVNNGVIGATLMTYVDGYVSCDRDHFDISGVPVRVSSDNYLFLAYGGNDVMINRTEMSPVNFKTQLLAAVDGVIAKGWPANKIVILNGYYLETLNDAIGECGVTEARSRGIAEQFVTASNEVASEKGTVLADVYTFTKNFPNRGTVDGLHYDVTTHRAIADYLEAMEYVPYVLPTAPVTLLTGATRYAPPGLTSLGSNFYAKVGSGDVAQVLGKNMIGDGFVASMFKSDAGFSHYLFNAGLTQYAGFEIQSNGSVNWDSSAEGEQNIPGPSLDEFIFLQRSGGRIYLKYGTTLENAVIKKDFGANTTYTVVTLNSLADGTRRFIYHPQGLNLVNA